MQSRKLPRRQYTDEFKVEAARLSESISGHEAARRLGVAVTTRGNWTRHSVAAAKNVPDVALASAAVPRCRPASELEAENSGLRWELADAKLEVEILRKATTYFAKVSR